MIGDRIKVLRENAGISQAELARRLGISRASVNAWEQGFSSPQASYIVSMAKLFHCSSDYILCLDNEEKISLAAFNSEEISILYKLTDYFGKR